MGHRRVSLFPAWRPQAWRAGFLAAASMLSLPGCTAAPAPVSPVAMSPPPAGGARIWFYRDYEPYVSLNDANVALNGAFAVTVLADGGALYRNVAPGHYHVTVESYGQDMNQAKDVDLGPGQEAFVKVLSLNSWEAGGDKTSFARDTFYISLVSQQIARAELPAHPFYGGR